MPRTHTGKKNKLGPIDQDAATAPAREAGLLKVKTANLYYCVCHEVSNLIPLLLKKKRRFSNSIGQRSKRDELKSINHMIQWR